MIATAPTTGTAARRGGLLARLAVTAGALGIAATAAGFAAPASAFAADVEREKHGDCTNRSTWELQLEKEHGRIEIDLDVDTPRSGQRWVIKLKHNGVLFDKVRRTTDAEGEFEVDRHVNNKRGEDRIKFRAVNKVTGEVCVGKLSI